MAEITAVGLDLAKHTFHIPGSVTSESDEPGRKRMGGIRNDAGQFFTNRYQSLFRKGRDAGGLRGASDLLADGVEFRAWVRPEGLLGVPELLRDVALASRRRAGNRLAGRRGSRGTAG
jgi:hypothetical protein